MDLQEQEQQEQHELKAGCIAAVSANRLLVIVLLLIPARSCFSQI
jgi:hypothetical protein